MDGQTEIDNHADTCVVGKEAHIVHEHDRVVNVMGYDPRRDIKVVSAVVVYDNPMSGEPILLQINQAVYIPMGRSNLLCPMKMRLHDVKVDECPKFLSDNYKM